MTAANTGKSGSPTPEGDKAKPLPLSEDPPTDPGLVQAAKSASGPAKGPTASPAAKVRPAKTSGWDESAMPASTKTPARDATANDEVRPAATTAAGAAAGAASGAATVIPRPFDSLSAPAPTAAVPAASAANRPVAATATSVGPRRARLMVTRLDPWSVMKTSFMLAVSIAVVIVVTVAVLWMVLQVTGVFDSITRTVDDLTGTGTTTVDVGTLISFGRVMGIALVIAGVEVILVSALATLFAFLYNLSVGITGGLQVTLSEDN